MADDQAQFETLLGNLISPDNDTRTSAETIYDGIPFTKKVPFLIQVMQNENAPFEVRTMGSVLLRRIYTSNFEDFWDQFSPESKTSIKEQMLLIIQKETMPALRRKMCDCTAEFARNMIDDDGNNTWPEVLTFLFNCVSAEDPGMKECALQILAIFPGIFGTSQSQYLDVIKQMLYQCLSDQNNAGVRFAAVKATAGFILANEKETTILSHYKDLLPGVIQGVADSVQMQEDDALLKNLIDLAEDAPKFLRSQIDNIVQLSMKIVGDTDMPDNWRQLALEVIVTLSETDSAIVRKHGKFLQNFVPQILAMMIDLEDEEDWSTCDEVEEEDGDSNAIAAEGALDRLACGLGGKTMLPHILSNVPTLLANENWRCRHAALMAISACGEGCHKQMEQMLNQIVETILPYLQDPHPRVRYACCNAIGQMSTDFGPVFQKKFHNKAVPGLLFVMDDYANPRVQAHAGAALVNFSEDCPKAILTPYLDVIIAKLEQILTTKFKELLEKGTKLVLEQVVTTLASVADTVEERFIQYYDRFMPCLKYIVQNAVNPELRLLRGKTIECLSLIGLAVGKDKFMQDCSEVMQLLLKTQTDWEELSEDDPQISYMISAWARMCRIMGKEFEQYLNLVMGPVLKAANIKPEVALVDSEDMKVMEDDTDWQFVTLGDQQNFGIRTAGLEEKATAFQMLVCYARELKEGFAVYVDEVVKIMVTHLKFYFHDGVRVAAAESLPYLLECARIKGDEYTREMWLFILPELLKAIESEPENDIRSEHMHAMAQCIEKMGKGCLQEDKFVELVKILDKLLREHFERQEARQEKRKEEDYDDVVEETLLEEDDEDTYLLSKVSDIMHSLFGAYKEEALPAFEQLLPLFAKLLGEERPWADKQWGLCIFDDLLEFTGQHSQKYQEFFVKQMVHYLCDKQAEVRQAASYGIGVMAQCPGQVYQHACTEAMPSLIRVIQEPESRSPENANATENCISAVTKICKFCPVSVNVAEVVPHWLSWLPVWEDKDEAEHIYNYLCDLVEGNNPVVLGENSQNIPRILLIIAEAFQKEAVDNKDEVGIRMLNIVRQIQGNSELFAACIGQMSPELQASLSGALSS